MDLRSGILNCFLTQEFTISKQFLLKTIDKYFLDIYDYKEMINSKKIFSSIVLGLFAVTMMTSMSFQNSAFAGDGEQGFSVTASAAEGSAKISVSGYSGSGSGNPITVQVVAPNGNIVAIDQLSPDDHGEFSTSIGVGPMWSQDGTYTINLQSGSASLYSASLNVDVANGVTSATNVSVDTVGLYGKDDGYVTKMQSATQGSTGLDISADAVEGATSFTINGTTDRTQSAVSIKVIAPNGNIVSIDQLTPTSDGTFSSEIGVGGPMWSQDGVYTVTAEQGDASAYSSTVEVEIADGAVIPEFGTIAALVLVVAIASIIAITAKGRLALTPRL